MSETLIIRRSEALGDVLLTTPIIHALKAEDTSRTIKVLTAHPEVFRGNPDVSWAGTTLLWNREPNPRMLNLDDAYERRPDMHIIAAYAEVAGIKEWNWNLHLYPSEEDYENSTKILPGRIRWAAFHIGPTVWKGRNWPLERFQYISHKLQDRGWAITTVGGKEDLALRYFWDARGLSLHQSASLISQCGLFVGIDSLPFHLAQWAGIPAVAVFGTIDPDKRCLPLPHIRGVQASRAEADCVGLHHRLPPPLRESQCDSSCMRAVSVDMVWQAIEEIIK